MTILKKAGLILSLVLIGLLDICIYWNYHLYYRSRKNENPEKKASLLEKSIAYFPLNDLAFYELGKSYFDLGISNLTEGAASEARLQKSVQNFEKSILINPASPFTHFHLAQSLLNLELVSSEKSTPFYGEFRKAALLAGENSQIFHEVGRIFLSRWIELSDTDRKFALEILRKTLAKKDREKISLVLNTWELNVKDYEMIEAILPEDARVYRQYAQFLGEKSLSLEKRHKYLARAESLDFVEAKGEFQSGEADLSRSRVYGAFTHFIHVLEFLREIRFYDALDLGKSISKEESSELMKSLFLNLAKCGIEKKEGLKEFLEYLKQYISLEDQAAEIGALDSYLKERGVIPPEFGKDLADLDRLGLELLLLFKRKRYDEIIDFSAQLERSLIVAPKAKKKDYVRIQQIVGDSFKEAGNLTDAEKSYQKALQIDPTNLETWLSLRQVYSRLRDDKKLMETNEKIEEVLTPKKIALSGPQFKKGQIFTEVLVLDGRDIILDIHFDKNEKAIDPLLSIFLNNRVVWDGYSQDGLVSIVLRTKMGRNVLQITPINCPISLSNLTYRAADGNDSLQD
jgi:tetratricopeptide (TPR) repeat protein